MSFKNAFKLLLGKFKYVWSILLYIVVMFVILLSVGLTFLKPVFDAFASAGVWRKLSAVINVTMDGATLTEIFTALKDIFSSIKRVFATDASAFWNSFLFVVIVMTILYRFIMGLCELPVASVVEGAMTDNAKYAFMGRYVALFGKSVLFSLVKMLLMTIYDTLMYALVFLFAKGFNQVSIFLVPFGVMITFVALLAFRYTLISAWSPTIILRKKRVFSSFGSSIKFAFKHFGSIFSTWVITWMVFIAINILVGIFTFGAGLLVSIPICIYFTNLLNMTIYFGKNKKPYYVDGAVFLPDGANQNLIGQ